MPYYCLKSEDAGKALENIVYLNLERTLGEEDGIFYFYESKECDFVVKKGERVAELIQVCWTLNDDNVEREIGGLIAASSVTGCKQGKIITLNGRPSNETDKD